MLSDQELSQLSSAVIQANSEKNVSARIWDYGFKALVPIVVAIVGWAIATDRSVAQNTSMLVTHSSDLVRHQVQISSQPPEWLKEIVTEVKQQNSNILQRLSSLEAEVHAVHGK